MSARAPRPPVGPPKPRSTLFGAEVRVSVERESRTIVAVRLHDADDHAVTLRLSPSGAVAIGALLHRLATHPHGCAVVTVRGECSPLAPSPGSSAP